MSRAVVLLSGGLDSSTVLAIARAEDYAVHALSFRYGQRHSHELAAAARIAEKARVAEHVVCDIDLAAFGGSALTDPRVAVPHHRTDADRAHGIPATYVPARNTIFLAMALGLAETREATDIFIGVNAIDYSGYPDCRPDFIEAFERLARLATRVGVEGGHIRVRAPLQHFTKADIIRRGLALGVDFADTHSCYDPDAEGLACGTCDACVLRLRGFAELGIADPARYRPR